MTLAGHAQGLPPLNVNRILQILKCVYGLSNLNPRSTLGVEQMLCIGKINLIDVMKWQSHCMQLDRRINTSESLAPSTVISGSLSSRCVHSLPFTSSPSYMRPYRYRAGPQLEDGNLDSRRQQLFPHLLVAKQDLPEFIPNFGNGEECPIFWLKGRGP